MPPNYLVGPVPSQGFAGATDTDKVWYLTYEPISGQIRTTTTPEMFPGGEVPDDFAPYLAYTTTNYFNIVQGGGGYDFPILVRTRDYKQGLEGVDQSFLETGTIDTDLTYNDDHRLVTKTYPSEISEEYFYYDSLDPADWDFRQGDDYSTDGLGPLAQTRTYPKTGLQYLATTYGYDPTGQLAAKEDQTGRRVEYDRSSSGELLEERVCAPESGSGLCEVSVASDRVLRVTRFSYDLLGRNVRSEILDAREVTDLASADSLGESWMTYDQKGNLLTTTVDPDPAAIPGESAPPGSTHLHLLSKSSYDRKNRVVKVVSPEGRVSCSQYDSLGRMTSVTKHDSVDEGGDACPAPDEDDQTTTVLYDIINRAWAIEDPSGRRQYRWFDSFDRPTYFSDGTPPGSEMPVFAGSAPQTPDAADWWAEITYDHLSDDVVRRRFWGRDGRGSSGYLSVEWNRFNDRHELRYSHAAIADGMVPEDVADLLEAPEDDAGGVRIATQEYRYYKAGQLFKQVDASGRTTDFQYDTFDRLERTLLPAGSPGVPRDREERHYDSSGRIERQTKTSHDPRGIGHTVVTAFEYDPWSRIDRQVGAPGVEDLVSTYEIDALGRFIRSARRWQAPGPGEDYSGDDPLDRIRETSYDEAGRVTRNRQRLAVDSETGQETWLETEYTYDRDGLVTELKDGNENRTQWIYRNADDGGLGRVLHVLYPAVEGVRQLIEIEEYDKYDNPIEVVQRTDEPQAPEARWIYGYDDIGRLSSATVSFESQSEVFSGATGRAYTHDDLGRVVSAEDISPSLPAMEQKIRTEWLYDTGGRLIEEAHMFPVAGTLQTLLVTAEYSLDGRPRQLVYPTTHDAGGQPLDPYTLVFTPDPAGRLFRVEGPPVTPWEPAAGESRDTRTLLEFQYSGDRIWSLWNGNGTEQRAYTGEPLAAQPLFDALGRSTGLRSIVVDGPSAGEVITDFRYGYDRVGNLAYEQRRHEPAGAGTYRGRGYTVDLLDRLIQWREGGLVGDDPIGVRNEEPAASVVDPKAGETFVLDMLGNWWSRTTGVEVETTETYTPNALNQYDTVEVNDGSPLPFEHNWLGQLRHDPVRDHSYVWDGFGRLSEVRDAFTGELIESYRYDAYNRRVKTSVAEPSPGNYTETWCVYDLWNLIEERAVIDNQLVVQTRYGPGWMDTNVGQTNRVYLHKDRLGSTVALSSDPEANGSAEVNVLDPKQACCEVI